MLCGSRTSASPSRGCAVIDTLDLFADYHPPSATEIPSPAVVVAIPPLSSDSEPEPIPSEPTPSDRATFERQPQMSLLEVDEDWRRVWQGMPEFIQQDLMPIKTIYVHFETRADIEAFAALVAQPIGMNTKSIWYPEAEIQQAQGLCAREVRLEVQRRPFLRHVVPLADPCLTLARMRGEG